MSTLLVSVLLATSLGTFAQVTSVANKDNYELKARQIAQFVFAEITGKCFEDPDHVGEGTLGRESGELVNQRGGWDDCDDYTGWFVGPIKDANGAVIPNTGGWYGAVTVVFCDPQHPTVPVNHATEMKLISLSFAGPNNKAYLFQTLRSKYGVLQQSQADDILSRVESKVEANGSHWLGSSRILNQQEAP